VCGDFEGQADWDRADDPLGGEKRAEPLARRTRRTEIASAWRGPRSRRGGEPAFELTGLERGSRAHPRPGAAFELRPGERKPRSRSAPGELVAERHPRAALLRALDALLDEVHALRA